MSVSVQVSDRNQWRVLTLSGRVDAFSDKRTLANLRQAAARPGASVVVNLERCEFISLYALKSLLMWKQELAQEGRTLKLLRPSDGIRRQLDVFLGRALDIYSDWETLEIETFYGHEPREMPSASWLT